MQDLSKVLMKAKKKKVYKNIEEFMDVLNEIMNDEVNIVLDWDNDAGEEWARIVHRQKGVVCMLNAKIGIVFARNNFIKNKTLKDLNSLFFVKVSSYSSEEWFVNLSLLEKELPEISWERCSNAIDVTSLSLDDLYFATISSVPVLV